MNLLNLLHLHLVSDEDYQRLRNLNTIEKDIKVLDIGEYDNLVLQDIQKYIRGVKNTLLVQSARINSLDDIKYRNAGADTCDVIVRSLETKKIKQDYNKRTGQSVG